MAELYLGRDPQSKAPFHLDSDRLVTHGVVLGMTGSGKTGLSMVLLEELAASGCPLILIDPKGDLASLGLLFPEGTGDEFRPWMDPARSEQADEVARGHREALEQWDLGPQQVAQLAGRLALTVYTPGSRSGVPVNVLGQFERPPAEAMEDGSIRRDLVAGLVSGLLSLVGVSADPVRSPEHIVLSQILEQAWIRGEDLSLEGLITRLVDPPFAKVGVFPLDTFYPPDDRMKLAMLLNGVLASPTFADWTAGAALDVDGFTRRGDRVPVSIFYLAHLSDNERMFFVSLLLDRILSWSRRQSGSPHLRCVVYFDEVAGYLPPHPRNPASKQPLLTLMKQARAVGVGVVLATQNPVDLDYKALSNAGTWMLGRLQTAQDRGHVADGLMSSEAGLDRTRLMALFDQLQSRVFLCKQAHQNEPALFQTRQTLCYLRGPMTRADLARLGPTALGGGSASSLSGPGGAPCGHGASGSGVVGPASGGAACAHGASGSGVVGPAASAGAAGGPGASSPAPDAVVRGVSDQGGAGHSPALAVPTPATAGPSPTADLGELAAQGLSAYPPPAPSGFRYRYLDCRVVFSNRLARYFSGHAIARRPDGRTHWKPALHAEVRLQFDESKGGFSCDETQHRLFFPLDDGLPDESFQVPLEDGDLLDQGEGLFEGLPAVLDESHELKAAQKALIEDIYRRVTRSQWVHLGLKLYGAAEESRAEFEARCERAIHDRIDTQVARLQARYARDVSSIQERIQRHQSKLTRLQSEAESRQTDQLWQGAEMIFGLFTGRKRSLRPALTKHRMTSQARARVSEAGNELDRLQDQVIELQARLETDIQAIEERERAGLGGLEERPVRLAKKDISLLSFGVLWIPITRRV